MRRIVLLTTLAAMIAAAMALSVVAQARPISGPADAKCAKLAIKTLGPSFNPSNYTFFGGNEVSNEFSGVKTEGPDVFCGFGGPNFISSGPSFISLDAGDIFLGGAGDDGVDINRGTFYGEEGNEDVSINAQGGTFFGGEGDDSVTSNEQGATFNGEAGNDFVEENGGRFVGGEGCDDVMFGDDPVDPPEGSCTI
jgi:Ca2+-binding RTX toxin-like protein